MKKNLKSQKRKLHLMAVHKKSVKSKKRHNKLVKFFNMYRNNVSEESKKMARNDFMKYVANISNEAKSVVDSTQTSEKEYQAEIIQEVEAVEIKEKKPRKKKGSVIQEES